MKAILTKYIPWSSTKPSRIKAYTEGGHSVTLSYDECSDGGRTPEQPYLYAARVLCDKMQLEGRLIGGRTDEGYAFTFAESWISEKSPTYYPLDKKKKVR